MSKARNGNRRCPNCAHFYAAHGYEAGTDRRPCMVPYCHCTCLITASETALEQRLNRQYTDATGRGHE